LFTFSEIRAVLEKGGSIVLNVDGSECESGIPFPEGEHRFITMPFRDWRYTKRGNDEQIRGNDYFAEIDNPNDFALGISARSAIIRPDGTVNYLLRTSNFATGEIGIYDFTCALGRSARVFQRDSALAIDTYVNYNEIKSALLFGKHMEFVMFTEACEDVDWLPPGDARHLGHKIENFAILNEAMPDEYLVFYHTNLYANSTDDVEPLDLTWGAFAYVLYKNGTVIAPVGLYQPPVWQNVNTRSAAVCQTGTSIQFTTYRDTDSTYVSYAQVKDATLKGHEMQSVVFTRYCEPVFGGAPPAGIVSHRFDQFQFFEAGDLWGPTEYLLYSAFSITPGGTGIIDEVKLYPNGTVLFDWLRWDVTTDAVTGRGELACSFDLSTLFHSVSRERGPTFSYLQAMRAIKNEGAIFELEIRFEGCTQGGAPINLQSIYGGVLWETLIREDASGIDYDFVGLVSATRNSGVLTDTCCDFGLYSVATIFVRPDNSVDIYPRTYDWAGNDLTPSPSPDPIVCKLNTGGLDGSVYFFRYP
jgi:hypothetical protein